VQEASSAFGNAYVRYDVCTNTVTGESEPCLGTDGAPGANQTKVGVYFTLDGMATGEVETRSEPMISFDSHLAGTELHGIVQKGGEFVSRER